MIRLLDSFDPECLRDSHCSRVIRAHFEAYGTAYDFCRFYEIGYRKRIGVAAVFNGSVIVDLVGGGHASAEARREIAEFIDFQRPDGVEIAPELALKRGYSGYVREARTFFEIPAGESAEGIIEPDPEAVFRTVYGNDCDYGLWLTDTVRRKNLGKLRLYGFETSVLTVRFMLGGKAYITDVATPEKDRGKGYARALLGGAAKILADEGVSAYLASRESSAGYYRSLGYKEIGADTVFSAKK